MTRLLLILLLAMNSHASVIHHCQVESYNETIHLPDCSSKPVLIQTTRCRGQCYSEDYLLYDWEHESTHYRHRHHMHCCSPTMTLPRETQVLCDQRKLHAIKHQLVTQCRCAPCTDRCSELDVAED